MFVCACGVMVIIGNGYRNLSSILSEAVWISHITINIRKVMNPSSLPPVIGK